MKTKNNVQKTVLRSLAVVVSFVLISFTVTAQDFWKAVLANSSFNEIALAMAETSKKSNAPAPVTENNSVNYIYENEYDGKLALEYWMTDNTNFEATSIPKVERDVTIEVEDWMLDENLYSAAQETDDELKVEDWMTKDVVWVN
jgi:outer membrane protein W